MGRRHAYAPAIAALVVGAGVVAGCGGGGSSPAGTTTAPAATRQAAKPLAKAAYDRRMRKLGRRFAASVQGLFPLVEAEPGTAVAKATVAKLERTRAVVVDVAAAVAAIPAPAAIRGPHRRLLNGLSSLRSELDDLIHVLQAGTSKPFGAYTTFAALRTIAAARNEIERKGFAIG